MRSSDPAMPWPLRAYSFTVGNLAKRAGAFSLEPEGLMLGATKKAQLDDFGNDRFRQGLDVLCDSAREADLTAFGHQVVHGTISQSLINRLLLVEETKRDPRLAEGPPRPPLIVLGLPRSGTTFLHRLLAADPASRAPQYFELVEPLAKNPARDKRLQFHTNMTRLRGWLSPELDQIHYLRANLPEECMFGLALTFESMLYWVLGPMWQYLQWYQVQDRDEKYRVYRQLLALWSRTSESQRLVLKAPAHTDAVAPLLKHVPNAMLVQTHRDEERVHASCASLIYETHRIVSRKIDVPKLGAETARFLNTMSERNRADRISHPDRVLDVQYEDLVADPEATVRRIYDHFELNFSPEFEAALAQEVKSRTQHKHGKHVYSGADFGLSPAGT